MTVIFDFNGTMVWDHVYHNEAWMELSTKLRGYPLIIEEFQKYVYGHTNEKIIEYLIDVDQEESQKISKEKEALYRAICRKNNEAYQLVPGLHNYLDYIKQKQLKCTIASASIKDNIDFFVDTFSLNSWFDPGKIVYDDGSYKDKVQMFIDAASNMEDTIANCIVFEDSVSGVACAKACNAKLIVAVATVEQYEQFCAMKDVDYVIKDFNDPIVYDILQQEVE